MYCYYFLESVYTGIKSLTLFDFPFYLPLLGGGILPTLAGMGINIGII